MADIDRRFKKPTLLDLIEGDSNNGSPDGNLKRDKPTYRLIGVRYPPEGVKRVTVELGFVSPQGSESFNDSRFLTYIWADVPAAAKTKLKDFYNWVTDVVIKPLPEFADGVEQ